MSENFMRPNTPGLTKIVEDALDGGYGSYDAMREGLKQALGMKPADPTREDFGYGASPSASLSAPQIAAAPGEPLDIRVLYLHGNSRFEIVGTQAQLDAQEAVLRALYQR